MTQDKIKAEDIEIKGEYMFDKENWFLVTKIFNTKPEVETLKQQILKNQEIVGRLEESLKIIEIRRNNKDKFIHIPFTETELQSILEGKK